MEKKSNKPQKIFQQNLKDFEEREEKTERTPRRGKLMEEGGGVKKKNQSTSWVDDEEDHPKINRHPCVGLAGLPHPIYRPINIWFWLGPCVMKRV